MNEAQGEVIGKSATVVVLPRGPAGTQLLELASAWTAAGLLTNGVWLLPEGIDVAEGRAPVLQGHLLTATGSRPVNVFDVLGSDRLGLVRVVLLQVLDSPDSADPALVVAAGRSLEAIRYSMPAVTVQAGVGRTGTQVEGVNVIAAATGVSGVSRDIVAPGWDLNVVVSPEDRPDPQKANAFLVPGENLGPSALAAAAVVGALVPGVSEGPFDSSRADASVANGRFTILRHTIRAVHGEAAVRAAASEAVGAALDSGGPHRSEPTAFTTAPAQQLVPRYADWLDSADDSALARSRDSEQLAKLPRQMHIKQGVLAFLRFYAGAVAAIPIAVWNAIVRRAESAATSALVGGVESSDIQITVVPRAQAELGTQAMEWEERDLATNKRRIADAELRPVRLATAELWRSLRGVSEALLDGSDLPPEAPDTIDGTRRVLLGASTDVVPAPEDVYLVDPRCADLAMIASSEARTIAACNPALAAAVAADLESARISQEATARTASERAAELRARLDELTSTTGSEESPSDPKRASEAAKVGSQLAEQRDLAARAADAAAILAAEGGRLSAWVARRSASLLWVVRQRVQNRAADASRAEAAARAAALAPSGLDESEPREMRRRFLKSAVWLLIVAVVSGVAIGWRVPPIVDTAQVAVEWLRMWHVWILWAGLLLLWLTMSVRRWYVGLLNFLKRFTRAADGRAAAIEAFVVANADSRRLQHTDDQLGSWAEILGWSLHHPWARDASPAESTSQPAPASLPRCVSIATPVLDDAAHAAAVSMGVSGISGRGWRRRSFERLVGLTVGARSHEDLVEAIDAIVADTTVDVGPRDQLLRQLRGRNLESQARLLAFESTAAALREGHLGQDQLRVMRTTSISGIQAQPVVDREFLAEALVPASPLASETWSDRAQVAGAPSRLTSIAWAQPGLAPGNGVVQVRALGVHASADGSLIDVLVRVDVSDVTEIGDLKVFQPAASVVVDVEPDSSDQFI